MAGYIGSKAVNLSTTGADINGDANIDGTLSSDGLTVDGDATLQNILNIGGSDPQIRTDTSDGSDNKTLWMGGGGVAYSWDRGGFFYAQGNEAGGHVGIAAGNVSGGSIKFTTGASESMRISSAGSVGIGVVPETWNSLKALQINSQASVSADASSIQLGANCYYNSGWKYINGAAATNYYQDSGVHVWRTAASGSADTAISWSEAMRIDSSGNVGIGTSSPSHPLTSAVNAASSNPLTDGANYALAIQNTDATAGNAVSMAFGHGGYNYTNFISSIRTGTGTDPKGDLIFGGRPSDGGTFVERMRLDSSGQVGINTATPNNYYAKKLVIDIGSDVQNGMTIVSGTSASGMIAFADGTSGASAYRGYFNYSHASDYLAIGTAGTEAMRIDASGHLLVGTSSSIAGNIQSLAAGDAITTRTTNSVGATNATAIGFQNASGSYSGAIYVNGSATTYATSSDHRLKENVVELTGATTRLKQLNPSRFNFITNADTTVDGFLAHEVQTVVPEAITGTHNEVDADGNPVYQGIDQSKLVPLLTAALQEALDEITDLKARVATLEAN